MPIALQKVHQYEYYTNKSTQKTIIQEFIRIPRIIKRRTHPSKMKRWVLLFEKDMPTLTTRIPLSCDTKLSTLSSKAWRLLSCFH